MSEVVCPKTARSQPIVCLPLARYNEDMTQKFVICYDCRLEQPGGALAVKLFYDSAKEP